MKTLWKCVMPMLIVIICYGCASSGKKTPAVNVEEQQKSRMNEMMEQVDRNAQTIRENRDELSVISQRLTDLENKINTIITDNSATTQEIKENLAFMNEQILRIDNSIRSKRPLPRPAAANVFKPDGFDITASYKGALNEYNSKQYESAIRGFTEVLTVAPQSDLADNAQYWIGECYYGMGNDEKALEAFYKVMNYPESNKIPDSHYKIGKTHLRMGNTDSAEKELKAVVQNYPGTSAAKFAARDLGKLED